jgi:large subunit ribosomal protein L4
MARVDPAPAPAKPAPRSRAGSAESTPVKAPLLDKAGKKSKDVTLEESVFGAEIKSHLVHETVRAELNEQRAGTRGAKSRGLVSGGRAKPWRQKGTGRARAGTIRAAQFTGGGVVFPPTMRSFEVKVNKKARHAALRSALSDHATNGTLGVIGDAAFTEPSTPTAAALVAAWGQELPLLVVARDDETALIKSFRNLEKVLVTVPGELKTVAVVWARAVLVTEGALPLVEGRAS